MLISVDELKELGINWIDICDVTGISEWAINEGRLSPDEPIEITAQQYEELKGN